MPDAVTYVGRHASSCGYCGSAGETSCSDGAVAHALAASTYGALIDDGWRRSGRWLYKPALEASCCAQRTIRVRCESFAPSKSQRKVMRRLETFLRTTAEEEKEEDDAGTAAAAKTGERTKTYAVTTARSTFVEEEFALWKKYQAAIHGDDPSELTRSSYERFLVHSPFAAEPAGQDTPSTGYGAFHQQYRIDGVLVAVGVVDILPKCLSSKYFFWDPAYAHLSLGKVSALEEIDFVLRERRDRRLRDFEYYYMGYYIHDCAKMRYKAEYAPSEIRCETTGRWARVDDPDVRARLDADARCARLFDDDVAPLPRVVCPLAQSLVGVFCRGELIAALKYADLDDFFHRFGLHPSPRARERFKAEQREWCARGGAAATNIMNLVDIERGLLRDEEEEEEEEEASEDDDDAFDDDDDDDDVEEE